MTIKRVLTIAGSDSGGGAGIQADLKTITALGGFGMSVITALTAQNTLGVHGIYEVPTDFIEKQFDAVATDIGADAAKTGMLSSSEIMVTVAEKVEQYGIEKLVVDPVMVAKGGAMLIRQDAKQTLIDKLLPLAFVITPNIPEAEELTGMKIVTVEDMKEAAGVINRMGAKNVFVKGGHMSGDALDILYDGGNFHEFTSERVDTKNTHGTGCTTSAAIATGLAQGMDVYEAVKRAKEYITEAIKHSLRIGKGHGPTNHMAYLFRNGGMPESGFKE
ncbi:MAG: bifunctional hydroxymethylpyrimidine kinase/phosphomethylpyrimidine kinase [Deltaproteobacteria bacterium]|nr:bifunctional hydroxymethylpyrimidine kinase/phosphomethylpyrimidine kinase [Deltaproteobacteria bacterium]